MFQQIHRDFFTKLSEVGRGMQSSHMSIIVFDVSFIHLLLDPSTTTTYQPPIINQRTITLTQF